MQLPILFYACLILPISLISGPLIPEILILTSTVLLSLKFEIFKGYFFQEKKFCIFFLLFNFYLIFISFFSDNYFLSFKNSVPYFRFLIVSIVIFMIIDNFKDKFFNKFLIIHILIFFIFVLDGYVSYLTGQNIFGFPSKPDRLSSLFGDEYILGSYSIRIMPLILVSLILSSYKETNQKILFLIILLLTLLIIIMSGERTALGLYIIFLFLLFFEKSFRKYFIKISLIIVLIMSGILFFFSNSLFVKRIIYDTINQVYDNRSINFFSQRHEAHFLTSYYILKNNLIFGSGPNSFRVECKKDRYIKLIEPLIISKHTYISPIDGQVHKVELSKYKKDKFKYFILDKNQQKILIQKSPEKYEILENQIKKLLITSSKFPLEIHEGQKLWVKKLTFRDGCNTHPHSIIFQTLAETGIIGFVFLFIFYFYLIKKIIFYQKIEDLKLRLSTHIILISLIINFFPLLPYGNMFNNWFSIVNFLPLGFLFYLKKLIKSTKF